MAKKWKRGQDIPGNGETTSEQARDVIQRLSQAEWVRFADHVSGAARFEFEPRFDADNPDAIGAKVGSGTGDDRCSRLAEVLQLRWFNNPISLPGAAMKKLHEGARALRQKLGRPRHKSRDALIAQLKKKGRSAGEIAADLKDKGYTMTDGAVRASNGWKSTRKP